MSCLRTRLALAAAALLLLFSPGPASAAMPNGNFEFGFGGVNSLWMGDSESSHEDADGFCADFGAAFDSVEHCSLQLFVDGRGKIGGQVEFAGWTDGNHIVVEGPIKGAQRGSNRSGITRASFVIRMAGTASNSFLSLPTSASLRFDGQINPSGLLTGTWTRTTCVAGRGCTTSRTLALASFWNNGGWRLALSVANLGEGALGGSARARFGDGTSCDFAISGAYDAKKDEASLALAPTTPKCAGGGIRLRKLTRSGSYDALVQFKLFGFGGSTLASSSSSPLPPGGGGSVIIITPVQPPPVQSGAMAGESAASISISTSGLSMSFSFGF
jgi:hypothetical protein